MSIYYTRAQTRAELEQILALQQENLKEVLSTTEMDREGFVSVAHSLELLEAMNRVCPHILAKERDTVAGYALCMHPDFSEAIPMLRPMFRKVRALVDPAHRFVIMGQICIGKGWRKKGIFRGLYASMQNALKGEFKSIITEVDDRNQRSLSAHIAVGFETLAIYTSGNRIWHLIQLPIINDQ